MVLIRLLVLPYDLSSIKVYDITADTRQMWHIDLSQYRLLQAADLDSNNCRACVVCVSCSLSQPHPCRAKYYSSSKFDVL